MSKKHGRKPKPQNRQRRLKERRTEVGTAARGLIATVVAGAQQQMMNRLVLNSGIAERAMAPMVEHESVDVEIDNPWVNLRMPRQWVKDVLQSMSEIHMVKVELQRRGKKAWIRVTGRKSDVALGAVAVERLILGASSLATHVYNTAYQEGMKQGKVHKARGTRREFLHDFALHLKADVERMKENLATSFGADNVQALSEVQDSYVQLLKEVEA